MAQGFEDFGHFGREFVDRGMKSATEATASAQAIAAEAADYAKRSFEEGVAAAGKIAAAKSAEDALQIQTDYARRSYENMVAEATRLSGLYADMVKVACKPFESIVGRVG